MIEHRMLRRITGPNELLADLTLVMKGFEFETVWNERTQLHRSSRCSRLVPSGR